MSLTAADDPITARRWLTRVTYELGEAAERPTATSKFTLTAGNDTTVVITPALVTTLARSTPLHAAHMVATLLRRHPAKLAGVVSDMAEEYPASTRLPPLTEVSFAWDVQGGTPRVFVGSAANRKFRRPATLSQAIYGQLPAVAASPATLALGVLAAALSHHPAFSRHGPYLDLIRLLGRHVAPEL